MLSISKTVEPVVNFSVSHCCFKKVRTFYSTAVTCLSQQHRELLQSPGGHLKLMSWIEFCMEHGRNPTPHSRVAASNYAKKWFPQRCNQVDLWPLRKLIISNKCNFGFWQKDVFYFGCRDNKISATKTSSSSGPNEHLCHILRNSLQLFQRLGTDNKKPPKKIYSRRSSEHATPLLSHDVNSPGWPNNENQRSDQYSTSTVKPEMITSPMTKESVYIIKKTTLSVRAEVQYHSDIHTYSDFR